jgi:hypothetical protein
LAPHNHETQKKSKRKLEFAWSPVGKGMSLMTVTSVSIASNQVQQTDEMLFLLAWNTVGASV